MKILVCVKEVIDPGSPLSLGSDGLIEHTGKLTYRMNRYDEFALEEAVLIREKIPGTVITAVSVGPARVKETLRKALGKGADHACHIVHESSLFLPPRQTASLIAGFAKAGGHDLILAGVMAEDDLYCQVGPLVAAMLGIPFAVSVVSEELDAEKGRVCAECEIEGGLKESVMVTLPCVLAVQSGINRPRYPSLSNTLRAKAQEIPEIIAHVQAGPGYGTSSLSYPPEAAKGMMLTGSRDDMACELAAMVHEKGLL
ncbi:MAG TPA: electron transfer flavoprotein subunit beta/FixA family protein [Spirochaetota bacterium]|nr:electron transfer flavoprotein subunit beta/FixA family protein [Spirochaetota bacterium]HPI88004.1 electron transfer flavoprotein subunit beta/FixA family protein [Spirochaetota bacterium]HPR46714.1 electron transfer flavoprotein subunit beta/FixA family protein [Spirochaetota bacterium]